MRSRSVASGYGCYENRTHRQREVVQVHVHVHVKVKVNVNVNVNGLRTFFGFWDLGNQVPHGL
jgi:hypothetical protein